MKVNCIIFDAHETEYSKSLPEKLSYLSEFADFHHFSNHVELMSFLKQSPSSLNLAMFFALSRDTFIQSIVILRVFKNLVLNDELIPFVFIPNQSDKAESILFNNQAKDVYYLNMFQNNTTNLKKFIKRLDLIIKSKSHLLSHIEEDKLSSALKSGEELFKDIINEEELIDYEFRLNLDNDIEDSVCREVVGYKKDDELSGKITTNLNIDGKNHNAILDIYEQDRLVLIIDEDLLVDKETELDINIRFEYKSCSVDLSIQGVLDHIEPFGDSTTLELTLSDDQTHNIENFMALFLQRQEDINSFLRAAQGRE